MATFSAVPSTASGTPAPTATATPPGSGPLRLRLAAAPAVGEPDGAWWPRSRDLQSEVRDLVDGFPSDVGRVNRLLYSRPDWDAPVVDRRGVRSVLCARGPVKVGSFPSDDTRLMVLTMASGQRLRLQVVPPGTADDEGTRLLDAAGASGTAGDGADPRRWDAQVAGPDEGGTSWPT